MNAAWLKPILRLVLVILPILFGSGAAAQPVSPTATGMRHVDARIIEVIPHDQRGNVVSEEEALQLTVRVALFKPGTLEPVPCDYEADMRVWKDGLLGGGSPAIKSLGSLGGRSLPIWEFANIDAFYNKVGKHPALLHVRPAGGRLIPTNLWIHPFGPAGLPRQQRIVPTSLPPAHSGIAPFGSPSHFRVLGIVGFDREGHSVPIEQASSITIHAQHELYVRYWGYVSLDWGPVLLYRWVDDGYQELIAVGERKIVQLPGDWRDQDPVSAERPRRSMWTVRLPPQERAIVWEFRDVDVSLALEGHRLAFMLDVDSPRVPLDSRDYSSVFYRATLWLHTTDTNGDSQRSTIPEASGDGCPGPLSAN